MLLLNLRQAMAIITEVYARSITIAMILALTGKSGITYYRHPVQFSLYHIVCLMYTKNLLDISQVAHFPFPWGVLILKDIDLIVPLQYTDVTFMTIFFFWRPKKNSCNRDDFLINNELHSKLKQKDFINKKKIILLANTHAPPLFLKHCDTGHSKN